MTDSPRQPPTRTQGAKSPVGDSPLSPETTANAHFIPEVGAQYGLPGILGVQQRQEVQVWQGQFPPPDALERYEALLPGAFDRLMTMAEEAQAAGIEPNKQANAYFRADVRRAHWLGVGVTVLAMVGALIALRMGSPTVAGLFLSVTVISVARALVESIRPSNPTDDRKK
jgi:uncharacterized membrane protein